MPTAPKQLTTWTVAFVAGAVAVAAVVAFALWPTPPMQIHGPSFASTPAPVKPPLFPAYPPRPTPAIPAVAIPTAEPANIPAWENSIDSVLRVNVDETQMAHMLINILPTLPEEGQVQAANHIANLLPDSDYNSVRPLLLNPGLAQPVLSVFFTDLMNRSDPTKLDSFLDLAQVPNHPFQAEALSDLQIYVGADYGTDWAKWKDAVDQYLKTSGSQ